MKEQSLIHVKVDYSEAVESKKDLLSSERELIRLLKTMKNYNTIRGEELNAKLKLQKKMKELNINLSRLNETLPKIKIPSILKKDNLLEETIPKIKNEKDKDLESQLREIQERLRRLG